MKLVEAHNQKTINLTAAQPIRGGDLSKDLPAPCEGVVTTFFYQQFLSAILIITQKIILTD